MVHPLPNARILVVHSDPVERLLIATALVSSEVEIVSATNRTEAHQLYDEIGDDIMMIVAEDRLPEMDGLALCRYVREHDYLGKILIVSQAGSTARRKEYRTCRIQGFLEAPVNWPELACLGETASS